MIGAPVAVLGHGPGQGDPSGMLPGVALACEGPAPWVTDAQCAQRCQLPEAAFSRPKPQAEAASGRLRRGPVDSIHAPDMSTAVRTLARRGGLRATADLSKRTIVAGHGPARGPRACTARTGMFGVTDPGHRRRPGPRTAPAARILLGFSREMPGFHPRTVRVFIPDSE
jgi:hypothetical protein